MNDMVQGKNSDDKYNSIDLKSICFVALASKEYKCSNDIAFFMRENFSILCNNIYPCGRTFNRWFQEWGRVCKERKERENDVDEKHMENDSIIYSTTADESKNNLKITQCIRASNDVQVRLYTELGTQGHKFPR